MNRSKATLLTLLVLTAATAPGQAAENASELETVRAVVAEKFDEIGPEDVMASPIEGWYTIGKGAIIAYISADGRYLLQGDLIDLERQANLSEQARNDARRRMMASVDDADAIVFTPADVQHTVNIFTDIDCTYCRRLHSQIDDYLAKGIQIRYLLYPRSGPTSASWVAAEKVWCADDRNEALTLAKLDQNFESRSCNTPMVSRHYAMGQDVGLRGTPAIVLEDGTLVSGYLPPEQLAAALNSAAAEAAASTASRE